MPKNNRVAKVLEIGKSYGNLTVLSHLGKLKGRREHWYRCKCTCGNTTDVRIYRVLDGTTRSCGCLGGLGDKNVNWKGYGELTGSQFGRIRKRASYSKLEFNLTAKYCWELYLLQDKQCALTKLPITMQEKSDYDSRRPFTASLDRIDSIKGYIVGNVQWVHKDVNFMKQVLMQPRFIELCKLVANNN